MWYDPQFEDDETPSELSFYDDDSDNDHNNGRSRSHSHSHGNSSSNTSKTSSNMSSNRRSVIMSRRNTTLTYNTITTYNTTMPPTPCWFLSEPPQRYVIDESGDLTIVVGRNTCTVEADGQHRHREDAAAFVVCSKSMVRASPVWKSYLHEGPFESARSPSYQEDGSWIMALDANDSPTAFGILLNIVHGRFDAVPGSDSRISIGTPSMSLDDLYHVAVLTGKYGLMRLVRPWSRVWTRGAMARYEQQKRKFKGPVITEAEKLLWVAWELGDATLFDTISRDLIMNSQTGIPARPLFLDTLEPPGASSIIESSRKSLILCITTPFKVTLDALMRTTDPQDALLCNLPTDSQRDGCQKMLLGTMMQQLNQQGLWPLPSSAQAQQSVTELSKRLKSLQLGSASYFHQGGSPCTAVPNANNEVDYIIKMLPTTVTKVQRMHLEARSKETGIGLAI